MSIVKQYAVLFAGVLLAFSGCATSGPPGVQETTLIETADGAIIVGTFTTIARVSAVDTVSRKVTLIRTDGKKTVYKAGPEVVNLDQVQAGDMVKVVLTEQAAVSLSRGAPASARGASAVAVAPAGSKPGAIRVDTMQVTARVTDVDAKSRKVTFEFPDGSTRKVKAGKQVDLSSVQPGDNLTVQMTEALAVTVEKP